MSFVLVKIDEQSNPTTATQFRPLRLGGPDGLVAKHVGKLGQAAESPWHLSEAEVVALAGADTSSDAVFFRSGGDSEGDSIGFCRLESLHGISTSDRTDLVCHFSQLSATPQEDATWTIEASKRGMLCESISLSGGISRGKWQWTDSPMSLGAAVVGGKCEGGCSSAPAAHSGCCGECH